MSVRSVVCFALLAGCNFVYGLDATKLPTNYQTLVFDNSASKIDLVDFPVLVVLDSTWIDYEQVADPKTQLRFFDPDTERDLPFEIERWEPGARSEIWVEVPQIDARSTTDRIEMYFGADAGGTEQPADVWSTHAFVYHGMPSKPASSIGSYPATLTDAVLGDGMIGSAPHFIDGETSNVAFANTGSLLNGWDRFTIELWLHPDYTPSYILEAGREPQFFTTEAAVNLGRLRSSLISTLLTLQIDAHFGTRGSYMTPNVQRAAWAYIVYTFDGQFLWIYRNGAAIELDDLGPTRLETGASRLLIGSRTNAMAGSVDELRVSNQYRPAEWVNAQYLSMTDKLLTRAR